MPRRSRSRTSSRHDVRTSQTSNTNYELSKAIQGASQLLTLLTNQQQPIGLPLQRQSPERRRKTYDDPRSPLDDYLQNRESCSSGYQATSPRRRIYERSPSPRRYYDRDLSPHKYERFEGSVHSGDSLQNRSAASRGDEFSERTLSHRHQEERLGIDTRLERLSSGSLPLEARPTDVIRHRIEGDELHSFEDRDDAYRASSAYNAYGIDSQSNQSMYSSEQAFAGRSNNSDLGMRNDGRQDGFYSASYSNSVSEVDLSSGANFNQVRGIKDPSIPTQSWPSDMDMDERYLKSRPSTRRRGAKKSSVDPLSHLLSSSPILRTSYCSVYRPPKSDKRKAAIPRPKGCKVVYFGALPPTINKMQFEDLISTFGEVRNLWFRNGKKVPNQCCTVTFADENSAEQAQLLYGHYLVMGDVTPDLNPQNVTKMITSFPKRRETKASKQETLKKELRSDHLSRREKLDVIIKSLQQDETFIDGGNVLQEVCLTRLCSWGNVGKFFTALCIVNSQVEKVNKSIEGYCMLKEDHKLKELAEKTKFHNLREVLDKIFKNYRCPKVWYVFNKLQRKKFVEFYKQYQKERRKIARVLEGGFTLNDLIALRKKEREAEKGQMKARWSHSQVKLPKGESSAQIGISDDKSQLQGKDSEDQLDSHVVNDMDLESDNEDIIELNAQSDDKVGNLQMPSTASTLASESSLEIVAKYDKLRLEHERHLKESKRALLEKDDQISNLNWHFQGLFEYAYYGITGSWPDSDNEFYTGNPEKAVEELLTIAADQEGLVMNEGDDTAQGDAEGSSDVKVIEGAVEDANAENSVTQESDAQGSVVHKDTFKETDCDGSDLKKDHAKEDKAENYARTDKVEAIGVGQGDAADNDAHLNGVEDLRVEESKVDSVNTVEDIDALPKGRKRQRVMEEEAETKSVKEKNTDVKQDQEDVNKEVENKQESREEKTSSVNLTYRELTLVPLFAMYMNTYKDGVTEKELLQYCISNGVSIAMEDIRSFLAKLPELFSTSDVKGQNRWCFVGLKALS